MKGGVGLIVHAASFQDFRGMRSSSTNISDRRTDGRTMTNDMRP